MADGDGAQNDNTFQLDIIDEKKAEHLNTDTDVSFALFNYFVFCSYSIIEQLMIKLCLKRDFFALQQC